MWKHPAGVQEKKGSDRISLLIALRPKTDHSYATPGSWNDALLGAELLDTARPNSLNSIRLF